MLEPIFTTATVATATEATASKDETRLKSGPK